MHPDSGFLTQRLEKIKLVLTLGFLLAIQVNNVRTHQISKASISKTAEKPESLNPILR
jgi:hypothetical protein